MPNYPIRCECGFTGDVFKTVKDYEACEGVLQCPTCKADNHQCYADKTVALHGSCIMFHGQKSESLTEGYHPKEVEKARKLMGGDLGACIKKDGTVKFRDRDQRTRWDKRRDELDAKSLERSSK